MVSDYEQSLLDDLEDARAAVKFDKAIINSTLAVIIVSGLFSIGFPIFLSVLHSQGEDWGEASAWPGILTVIIMIASIIFNFGYFAELRPDPTPREELKKAERKYRDYLNRQAEN